ncbi:MAG TPA: sporulation membrane protein YtaF [Bacillota bacterium]|nr:sporulation membrane protein YtaF [Bacillota bacterium]
MLAVVLFAIAVSVDGFFVGIAQGMRGIKVPVATLIVISVVSALVIFLSLGSGDYVANRLSPQAAKVVGSGILIILGILMLKPLSLSQRRNQVGCDMNGNDTSTETVISKIARVLIMIPGFLAEPVTADLDSSGTLTIDEGFLLGLALAIDALGVGFGAGMAGMSSALTPVVAGVMQGIFVSLGLILGKRMHETVPNHILEKAPGSILILLGAMRLK